VGSFALGTLTGAARGTAAFVLQVFVFLYALFFFLRTGADTLRVALAHLPLSPSEKEQLLERFLSVARATLKGSLLIGVIQGGTAGVAFWVAGVPGAAFWGAVMVFFSILPAVGAGLVWVPAVAYLLLSGEIVAGILLLVWCALVVGTLDNLLRPYLIGRDARMSDLMIFLSTLGGLALFGAVGFVAGPIVAALFVTVWHIYGEAFREWLPAELAPVPEARASPSGPPAQAPPAGPGLLGG
jgi:predicted PurR-regulated permease PerM